MSPEAALGAADAHVGSSASAGRVGREDLRDLGVLSPGVIGCAFLSLKPGVF